ncbi:UNVERIFIED_CONTAM: hypothetical protein FKN15_036867 [Acipenser sinensis]
MDLPVNQASSPLLSSRQSLPTRQSHVSVSDSPASSHHSTSRHPRQDISSRSPSAKRRTNPSISLGSPASTLGPPRRPRQAHTVSPGNAPCSQPIQSQSSTLANLDAFKTSLLQDMKALLQPVSDSIESLNSRLTAFETRPDKIPLNTTASTSSVIEVIDQNPTFTLTSATPADPLYNIESRRITISPALRKQIIEDPEVPQPGPRSRPQPSPRSTLQQDNIHLNNSISGLLQSARGFMENALAPSTHSSYSTAWSSFTQFCEQNRISYTSYNLQLLLAFIAHLRLSLRLAPSSIRCYLAGIQYQFRLQSIPSPLLSSVPEIRLTFRGMEKSLPPSSPSRQPISTDLLLHLIIALRQGCFNPFDDIVMETLCLIAFFGFLRCSEFSTPSTSSFPALGLKRSDLSQIPGNHFILHIRSSKTDQLSQGQSFTPPTVRVGLSSQPLPPGCSSSA